MSRLSELIARVASKDVSLAEELAAQVRNLAERREFGLNFERHVPETVQLPGRKVRRGDTVIVLPPRGDGVEIEDDQQLYRVTKLRKESGRKVAEIVEVDVGADSSPRLQEVNDLVVVVSFREPIFPGLKSTGRIERGGDKPFHSVINAENYHALQGLSYSLGRQVDAIYIDPPYNTRDKDWKYNNDYVDDDDEYRHSKWLAFMERRLRLAANLLNPERSVLIVTIDERECNRLGLLLEQVFPDARIQMVSSYINPAGAARSGGFGRSDEYLYFVMLGDASPVKLTLDSEWITGKGRTHTGTARWDLLRRSGSEPRRVDRPGCFYPIYIDVRGPEIVKIGEPLPEGVSRPQPVGGAVAVLPIRKDGSEGRWMMNPAELRSRMDQGRVRVNVGKNNKCVMYYLADGEYKKILDREYEVTGRAADGSLILRESDEIERFAVPSTQWRISSHDSTQYGSRLLSNFLPDRKFPYPKSLYAVEDALRFFVKDIPDALVVDFFAGSGTTAHAVFRLNKEDGGTRRSVSVTNNEVSHDEAKQLRTGGFRPGDDEWEKLGICHNITIPRLRAALTGVSTTGSVIAGEYKFSTQYPIAEGFEENIEFFDLTYEDLNEIRHGSALSKVGPLLWLKAGAKGNRTESTEGSYTVAHAYALLLRIDSVAPFLEEIRNAPSVDHVFVATDSEVQYQLVAEQLPDRVQVDRMFAGYLQALGAGVEGD